MRTLHHVSKTWGGRKQSTKALLSSHVGPCFRFPAFVCSNRSLEEEQMSSLNLFLLTNLWNGDRSTHSTSSDQQSSTQTIKASEMTRNFLQLLGAPRARVQAQPPRELHLAPEFCCRPQCSQNIFQLSLTLVKRISSLSFCRAGSHFSIPLASETLQ
jgi:hypothetical protein